MTHKRFVFAGNRFFVLEEMMHLRLNISKIFAVKDSFLQAELDKRKIPYTLIESKQQLVKELDEIAFDYFIANGLPVILPESLLKKSPDKIYINIHPSPLPSLRGRDPIPGAILFNINSGATCHIIETGIDTGKIISKIEIPMTSDLDCGLLYQMSFYAEKEVFAKAYKNNFLPTEDNNSEGIYYSINDKDLLFDFSMPAEQIVSKIKAFNTRSQGAYFVHENKKIKVLDVEAINNSYLNTIAKDYKIGQVVFKYENKLVVKCNEACLKLKNIEGDIVHINKGDVVQTIT